MFVGAAWILFLSCCFWGFLYFGFPWVLLGFGFLFVGLVVVCGVVVLWFSEIQIFVLFEAFGLWF